MNQVFDLCKPLIGQLVWSVRKGLGTFLTMEFGLPHLAVREPISPMVAESGKVKRNLSRRRVFVEGDWHFWIQDTRWRLRTEGGVVDYNSDVSESVNECLLDLEGQRLLSLEMREDNTIDLIFDLGGNLEVGGSLVGLSETQWSLHHWQGTVTSFKADGTLTVEREARTD
jgi:hypothetical protein